VAAVDTTNSHISSRFLGRVLQGANKSDSLGVIVCGQSTVFRELVASTKSKVYFRKRIANTKVVIRDFRSLASETEVQ
jgi:hypothetical protein